MPTATVERVAPQPVLPPSPRSVRLRLLARSTRIMVTSNAGSLLLSLWLTVLALGVVTLAAPLVLPTTALVRKYADAHRRGVRDLTGDPMPSPYRTSDRDGLTRRVLTVVKDPASWRDALWLVLHSIVGCLTSALSVTLFAGTVFYAIYPLLFAVTPRPVFSKPFGGLIELHSVTGCLVMVPFALVSLGLWYVMQIPLTRVELSLTRSLLEPRATAPSGPRR